MLGGIRKQKRIVGSVLRTKKCVEEGALYNNGVSPFKPTVYHALVVIFLEFFAWGLLTTPTITITHSTFPQHTFLCNGLIQGVKGLLSFLSAPLVGALSDVLGRKPFLLLTVATTCAPIPFMMISPWWYFALISLSGVFAVTFSVVFAYVADITTEEERSSAYGLVSATFAASLITSPAIGTFIERAYSQNVVIIIATAVAVLDVLFILAFMPESLPDKMRPTTSWGSHITWDKADPFSALRKIGRDKLILLLCIAVFLSYLPESGEYSCFFVYLQLVMNFSEQEVSSFIAFIGILSVFAQTIVLAILMKEIGAKHSIVIGLTCEMIQLTMYGFGSQTWIMWCAGLVAAASSITYPAISAFVSSHASADQQGLAQGVVTGIRGLCNGLGPALFGLIFYLFDVDLNKPEPTTSTSNNTLNVLHESSRSKSWLPGPPFAFGAVLVLCAIIVSKYIPENPHQALVATENRRTRHESVTRANVTDVPGSNYEKEKLLGSSDDTV